LKFLIDAKFLASLPAVGPFVLNRIRQSEFGVVKNKTQRDEIVLGELGQPLHVQLTFWGGEPFDFSLPADTLVVNNLPVPLHLTVQEGHLTPEQWGTNGRGPKLLRELFPVEFRGHQYWDDDRPFSASF
jgi:hypothetical protein